MLEEGLSSKQIAARLKITKNSVDKQLKRLYHDHQTTRLRVFKSIILERDRMRGMRYDEAMSAFAQLRDWLKYERLHHYPALKQFDRDEALRRLKRYEQEEPWSFWLILARNGLIGGMMAVIVLALFNKIQSGVVIVPYLLLMYLIQFLHFRRVRRRVQAKIEAELSTGRLPTCLECGYDLRGSDQRCPECGADARVPPFKAD